MGPVACTTETAADPIGGPARCVGTQRGSTCCGPADLYKGVTRMLACVRSPAGCTTQGPTEPAAELLVEPVAEPTETIRKGGIRGGATGALADCEGKKCLVGGLGLAAGGTV
mmetsp:Transcript_60217/g.112507  ORF Transcript_60217/g.112507 Transcript_60217/m.112507 type:complete len:112 (+) Transcript_60217:306-641(+)